MQSNSVPCLIFLLLAFCVSVSCVSSRSDITKDSNIAPETGLLVRQTLQHDGIEREYFVYLPSAYEKGTPLPLVIGLHGYTTAATGFAIETTTGFNHYAERKGFIAVYPQATHFTTKNQEGKPWVISSWNDLAGNKSESPLGPMCSADSVQYPCPPECGECGRCHWTSCNDDVGFINKLLEELKVSLNTDENRYYLIGVSNGAMMAHRLACELNGQFSAVALTIARLERGFSCTPDQPMALIQINGGLDTAVPPDGSVSSDGYFYTSTLTVSEDWARRAKCNTEGKPWNNDITRAQGLLCLIYDACENQQTEIIDCIWPEGLHVWPGNIGGGGWCVSEIQKQSIPEFPLCRHISKDSRIWGSDLIWDFFSQHTRN